MGFGGFAGEPKELPLGLDAGFGLVEPKPELGLDDIDGFGFGADTLGVDRCDVLVRLGDGLRMEELRCPPPAPPVGLAIGYSSLS